jgi:hypothetical protein
VSYCYVEEASVEQAVRTVASLTASLEEEVKLRTQKVYKEGNRCVD